ncbi:Kinesin-like protein kif26b, partial [Clonorchis sinensis]
MKVLMMSLKALVLLGAATSRYFWVAYNKFELVDKLYPEAAVVVFEFTARRRKPLIAECQLERSKELLFITSFYTRTPQNSLHGAQEETRNDETMVLFLRRENAFGMDLPSFWNPADSFSYLRGFPSLCHICPANAKGNRLRPPVPEFSRNLLNESHKNVYAHKLKNCSKHKSPLFEQHKRQIFPSKSSQPRRNLCPLNKCIPACSAEFCVDSTPRRDQSSYHSVSRLRHPLPTHTLAVSRSAEASSFVASTWSNSNDIVQLNYSKSIPFATAAVAAAQPIIQIPRGSIKFGHLIKTDHSISKLMHPTVRESSSVNIAESPGSPGITDSQKGALVLQTDGCGHKNELSLLNSSPQISSAGPLSPRAGQKPGIRTKNVKKYPISNDWPHAITAQYARTHFTGFAAAIHKHPPPVPPGLLKHIPTADATGTVKTILRLVPPEASKFGSLGTCLTIEKRRKQATLICPSPSTAIPVSQRRAGFGAPKMFAFDEVFSEQETTSDLCASALPDIIQAVVSGSDCCLIVLTNCRSNQAGIITGSEKPPTDLGIIPCSISWLFKLIAEQKEQTGARFSVRVSALEVDGQDESVKDLLVEVAQVSDALGTHPPGLYLREESVAKASMENQSELRAPTPEKAAFYLDSALNARARANKQHTTAFVQSDALHTPSDLQTANLNTSHFFFTLHLYQYRIEKCGGSSEVSGGRSRLHLIELDARCPDARDVASAAPRVSTTISSNTPSSTSPPITTSSRMTKTKLSTDSIISVILSILSGQTYIPYRNSHLARLLRDCLGGVNCQHCIVIEASSGAHHYAENLQLLQLVQRVQHHR